MGSKRIVRPAFILFGLALIILNLMAGIDSFRGWINLAIGGSIVMLGLINPINVFKNNRDPVSK